MGTVHKYQEAIATFDASDVPDLYAIHQRTLALTHGNPEISYAPFRPSGDLLLVLLRALPGVKLPGGMSREQREMHDGMVFPVQSGVRLVKRSDAGERMPSVDEAMTKWNAALLAGGFRAENTRLEESTVAFYHRRLGQPTRLPFWIVNSELTVLDAERAAVTMVRGIGRSRGLGFGMLMKV